MKERDLEQIRGLVSEELEKYAEAHRFRFKPYQREGEKMNEKDLKRIGRLVDEKLEEHREAHRFRLRPHHIYFATAFMGFVILLLGFFAHDPATMLCGLCVGGFFIVLSAYYYAKYKQKERNALEENKFIE